MDLPPFLLDQWMAKHNFATPPIAYDLASSTGPKWTIGELLALGEGASLDDAIIGYAPSEGTKALRQAIGAFLGVDPDWVVVTTGASEAYSILLCLAARAGEHRAVASGVSGLRAHGRLMGIRRPSRQVGARQRLSPGCGRLLAAVDGGTALALVNTPHNPAGTVMPREEIASLASALKPKGVPLIVDEVYHPLYFGAPQATAASIENVTVMSDMSKAQSLAGLRIGWLVERDPRRREKMIDARSYFTISSSPVLERLAVHAFAHHDVLLSKLHAMASENLAALSAFMDRVSDVLAWARPAGGTVCFPWFRDGRDSRAFCEGLAAMGVLVAPGDCFGMPEHMRVGFALLKHEKFLEALAIFERALRRQ